jgi:hypothetical protein
MFASAIMHSALGEVAEGPKVSATFATVEPEI